MSKKSLQHQAYQQSTPKKRAAVEVVNMDDLAMYQDGELESRAKFLWEEIDKRGGAGSNPYTQPFEIELAYVQREGQIRHNRRIRHREYLASLDEGYVDERDLPVYEPTTPFWN